MKKLSALVATIAALTVGLSVIALPAQAKAAKGTASINTADRDILAGGQRTFRFTVTNPATDGTAVATNVNYVSISPQDPTLFRVLSGSGPLPVGGGNNSQWSVDTNAAANRIVFRTTVPTPANPSGDPILPGQSKTFTVVSDVLRPAKDVVRPWQVAASDDAGRTTTTLTPATSGALNTTIRVLRVVGVELTAPATALDNSITDGQEGVGARVRVQNAGSAPLTVTPSLTGTNGTTVTSNAAPQVVPAVSEGVFDFVFTAGGPSSTTLTGDAVGSDGTGNVADSYSATSSAITVLTRPTATYSLNSLTPRDVVPGNAYAFQLTVSKTGQAAMTIDPAETFLRFGTGSNRFSASINAPITVGANSQTVPITFKAATVPAALADGAYTPTLRIGGPDENGVPIRIFPSISNTITLDRAAPAIAPLLNPAASLVQGATPAATNNVALPFGGTIRDKGAACGSCVITSAQLRQFDASGNALPSINVTPTNSNGNIGGSFNGTFDPAARSVQLFVVARDAAFNSAEGISPAIPVDNQAPQLQSASTGPARDRIVVRLSELVARPNALPFTATEWSITDNSHVVTDVQLSPSNAGGDVVTLTVAPELGLNERPQVSYTPAASSPARDRVGIQMPAGQILPIDGILPPTPVIDMVSGQAKQNDGSGDKFFTNDSTPDFVISNVTGTDVAEVYRDVNNSGQIEETDDELLGSATASQTTVEVTSKDLGTIDQSFTVLARVRDTSGQLSTPAAETLVLDFTAPSVTAVASDTTAKTVSLTFSESLVSGRDFSEDWTVLGQHSLGFRTSIQPDSVSGADAVRTLTVDYDPAQVTLDQVRYDLVSSDASDRYSDRAGNSVANFIRSF